MVESDPSLRPFCAISSCTIPTRSMATWKGLSSKTSLSIARKRKGAHILARKCLSPCRPFGAASAILRFAERCFRHFLPFSRSSREIIKQWDIANAEYYQNVDWALDIREATFGSFSITAFFALVRRAPETTAVVTREAALQGNGGNSNGIAGVFSKSRLHCA